RAARPPGPARSARPRGPVARGRGGPTRLRPARARRPPLPRAGRGDLPGPRRGEAPRTPRQRRARGAGTSEGRREVRRASYASTVRETGPVLKTMCSHEGPWHSFGKESKYLLLDMTVKPPHPMKTARASEEATPRRQYRSREDRRRQIIEATLQLLSGRGPRNWTIALVAERVGVSEATLFKHFANKDDI